MRLLCAAVTAVLSVMVLGGPAASGQEVERSRVKFRMTSQTCPRLPSGTVLRGTGRSKSVTSRIANSDGTTTVVNYTRARGIARSNRGGRHRFDYQNSFAITNTVGSPAVFSGTMFDVFDLVRRGRTTLANGFVAIYTTDFAQLNTYSPLYAFGDPVAFPAGTARCDPL